MSSSASSQRVSLFFLSAMLGVFATAPASADVLTSGTPKQPISSSFEAPKSSPGVAPDRNDIAVPSSEAALTALSRGDCEGGFRIAATVLGRQIPDTNALGVFAVCAAVLNNREAVNSALNRLRLVEEDPYAALLAQGVLYLRDGAADKAEESFKAVLQKHPADPVALYFGGEALQARHKDAEAIAKFDAVLKTWPDFAPALASAARLRATTKGGLKEALAMTQRAAAIDPKNAALKRQLAELYDHSGQGNKARELYVELLRGIPGAKGIYLNAAWALLQAGKDVESLRQVDEVFRQYGPEPLGYLIRAMADADQGKRDKIGGYLTAYLDSSTAKAQANSGAGLVYLAVGDADNAYKHFEASMIPNSSNTMALVNLAVSAQVGGSSNKAANALNKAVASGQSLALLAFLSANLDLAKGDEPSFKRSLAKAEQFVPGVDALQLVSGDATKRAALAAERNVAVVMYLSGWYAQVIRHADKALEASPRDAIALYFRGQAQLALSRPEDAVLSLRRATEAEPRFLGAFMALATAQAARHDALAAFTAYQSALALKPGFAPAQLGAARALLDIQRQPEALDLLRQAESTVKDCPALFQLAELNERGGGHDKAREFLKKTLQTPNCEASRPDALRLLSQLDRTGKTAHK